VSWDAPVNDKHWFACFPGAFETGVEIVVDPEIAVFECGFIAIDFVIAFASKCAGSE
jgi:hypothetical protein